MECEECGEPLPDRIGPGRRSTRCLPCRKIVKAEYCRRWLMARPGYLAAWRAQHPEYDDYSTRWFAAHPGYALERYHADVKVSRVRNREYYAAHPEACREYSRRYR